MDQILSILGSLGFNWHVAIANFVNFLVILYLLQRFFFGKIKAVVEEREGIIKEGLTNAEEAKRALVNAEAKKAEIITGAEKEGQGIISRAAEDAHRIGEDMKKKASEEIDRRLAEMKHKEERVQEDVEKRFSQETPMLIAKLFAKTLKKEMNEAENNAFIARVTS